MKHEIWLDIPYDILIVWMENEVACYENEQGYLQYEYCPRSFFEDRDDFFYVGEF